MRPSAFYKNILVLTPNLTLTIGQNCAVHPYALGGLCFYYVFVFPSHHHHFGLLHNCIRPDDISSKPLPLLPDPKRRPRVGRTHSPNSRAGRIQAVRAATARV